MLFRFLIVTTLWEPLTSRLERERPWYWGSSDCTCEESGLQRLETMQGLMTWSTFLSSPDYQSIYLPTSSWARPPTKEITASLVIMRFYINKDLLLPIKHILWWYATKQSVLNERNPTLSDRINGWNTLCNALCFIFMLCVDILIFWIQQHVISVVSE